MFLDQTFTNELELKLTGANMHRDGHRVLRLEVQRANIFVAAWKLFSQSLDDFHQVIDNLGLFHADVPDLNH